jgi:hypothetical protein
MNAANTPKNADALSLNEIYSLSTPNWNRFYKKCKQEIKDSRYYRSLRKKSSF